MNQNELIETYIEKRDTGHLTALLESMKYDEVLEVLQQCSDEDKVAVFEVLDEYIAMKCFKVLPEKTRQLLVKKMHYEKAAKLLNSLPDDDLTSFIEGLPSRVVNEWLKLLSDA